MEKLTVAGLTFELRPMSLDRFRESMKLLAADKDSVAHNDRVIFHTVARVLDEKGRELDIEWGPFFERLNLAHMRQLMTAVRQVNDLEDEELICPHCGRNAAAEPVKKNESSSASATGLTGTPATTGRPSSTTGAPSDGDAKRPDGGEKTPTGPKWWQRR